MVGWHHQLNGHEFEQAPGAGDGPCCDSQGHKESDTTERLDWTEATELNWKNEDIFSYFHCFLGDKVHKIMLDYGRNFWSETCKPHIFYLASSGEKTHHSSKNTRQRNVATLRRLLMMSVKYWMNKIFMSFQEENFFYTLILKW